MNILKQNRHSDKIAQLSFFLAIAILTFPIFSSFLLPFSENQLLICSLGNGLSLLLFLFAYYLAYVFKSDLPNEKNYYLNALEQAGSAIAILDKNQRVKWANAQFRKWNGQEKVEGKYFLDITTNQVAAKKVMEQLNQSNQRKGEYKSKTIKEVVVKTIINKLQNPPGSYVVIDTDISDLEKADKYQKLVLALFGHDTQKYTRLSLEEVNDLYKSYEQDVYLKKELGELLVYVEHSFDLSKNLNDWGDLVFKRGNLVSTKFIHFKKEVEKAKRRYAIFFKHYKIDLVLSFEDSLSFHADPDMLGAILRNLISNAIEAILNRQNPPNDHPKKYSDFCN